MRQTEIALDAVPLSTTPKRREPTRKKKRGCLSRRRVSALPALTPAFLGTPRRGAALSGRLSLLTFFGEAKKVSSCRAAPGEGIDEKEHNSLYVLRNEFTAHWWVTLRSPTLLAGSVRGRRLLIIRPLRRINSRNHILLFRPSPQINLLAALAAKRAVFVLLHPFDFLAAGGAIDYGCHNELIRNYRA